MDKHVVRFPVIPIVPAGAGLSPGDASSVAPMGIPIGATGEPGAMPSGEVAPIPGGGLPIPPTCAKAAVQPKSAACITAINKRRIMISIVRAQRSGRLVNHNIDAASVTDVRPLPTGPRAVRRAVPIITISVARPVTAMAVIATESASETAAHAGSTKVAAYGGSRLSDLRLCENHMRSIRCGNVFGALIAEFGCVNSGEKMFPGTEKDRRNGQVHFVN
jgi:hypothetical protein